MQEEKLTLGWIHPFLRLFYNFNITEQVCLFHFHKLFYLQYQ